MSQTGKAFNPRIGSGFDAFRKKAICVQAGRLLGGEPCEVNLRFEGARRGLSKPGGVQVQHACDCPVLETLYAILLFEREVIQ